jgi:tetratricopeptide (TPR) repeat protein
MKSFMVKAGATALLGLCVFSLGWSQGGAAPAQGQGQAQGRGAAQPGTPAPGTPAAAPAPTVSKEEVDAYNKVIADTNAAGDARQRINAGEAFLTAYPNSMYAGAIYGHLTADYLSVNDVDKMLSAGEKALASDPNNVDVLPLMAFAIPRRNGTTAAQLETAMNYAKRAINLLSTMPTPAGMDEATFAKVKNEKLAQCRSGMGTAYFKTGHYDDAVTELAQAVRLDPNPDPVDFYVLGLSNDRSSHFQDAIAAFDKCAGIQSSLQANCKNLSAETKKKAANSLEAPR